MRKTETTNTTKNTFQKRFFGIISIITVLILATLITVLVWVWLSSFSQDSFRDFIRSFGATGWLVLLGLQVLQVFVALIPGELLESAAGYVFGPFMGTVLCYLGVFLGSAVIFFLTRRFGVKLVEIFVDREKINNLRFMNTAKKRGLVVFFLYFIPGTPKDLFTYFIGLTDIRFSAFLAISLVARFPSIITSTFGGHLIGEGEYLSAVLLYLITGIVSLIGLLVYNSFLTKRNKNVVDKESEFT